MHVKRQRTATTVLADTVPTEPAPAPDVLAEAVSMIDHSLATMAHRQLVTANEVSDLLLDLRVALLVAELELAGCETPTPA